MNQPALLSHVSFEQEEITRINRARLCLILHRLPHEIDAASWQDIEDIIAVYSEDTEAAKAKAKG